MVLKGEIDGLSFSGRDHYILSPWKSCLAFGHFSAGENYVDDPDSLAHYLKAIGAGSASQIGGPGVEWGLDLVLREHLLDE